MIGDNMNYYNNELKESIKNDYVNGISFDDIVSKYNLERQVVRYILKKTNVYKITKTVNKWTNEEIELLKEYYKKYDFDKIDKLLIRHPHRSIVNMCHKLGLNRKEYRKNTKIKLNSDIYSDNIVYPQRDIVQREENAVISYPVHKNPNCKPRADWYTKEDMDFIINNYKEMNDEEIGKIINRTKKSVQAKRLELGIKRQGIGSYCYLQDFLRRNNYKWKQESMQKCNYKCVLSGNRFDEIHHIVGFNYILDVALKELNFNFIYDVRYYTDSELKTILNKFREVQARYPLGVCLTKEFHEKFHSTYGYGNNTQKQWNEFYKNNK